MSTNLTKKFKPYQLKGLFASVQANDIMIYGTCHHTDDCTQRCQRQYLVNKSLKLLKVIFENLGFFIDSNFLNSPPRWSRGLLLSLFKKN